MNFVEQKKRIDVLNNILSNINISSKKLFKIIITDNKISDDERRIGFLFETLSIILLTSKCFKIEFTNIMDGQLQSLKECNNINGLLKQKIIQGNNPSDITIKCNDKIIAFSVKYRNKFLPNQSSVSELDGELSKIYDNYLIGLIVKDKNLIIQHNYKNDGSNQKKLHSKVIKDNLLLDEKDIIEGLEIFCEKFKNMNVDEYIETINKDYLNSSRKQLKLKLHQKMTFLKFIKNKKDNLHLISHKPRSGKSITIIVICKYLLENGYDKILIMTSVPDTIKSFIKDLDEYINFKNIKYTNQEEFKNLSKDYKGIVFCSVQYLKTNSEEKKKQLKKLNFDTMIIDECHLGSSTSKTEKDILFMDLENIRSNIKMNIFASGTSEKTKKFYKIKNVYDWSIEDESYIKRLISSELNKENKKEIIEIMKNRHGDEFEDCLYDDKLNKDYSKMSTQVLIKHLISDNIINEINEYNKKNNTEYGYSCSSLFGLVRNKKGYDDMFELETNSDGIELLKSFFDCIISSNRMNKNSMIKKIEETQSFYKSRISQKGDPKLFLMYLPTHTGNNNILQLQTNIKRFIEKYKLWHEYNIEYTNSIDDSSDCKEEYNKYIQTILDKSKKENKKGCILLLGNKGGVGITYHDCDTTISLDDGHNLDNQRQRFSRALTEAEGKIVGINVDMNIQRTYLYLNDIIHKHRKITNTTKTNGEILKYLYENNVFLFNPSDINNGKIKTFEITEYYNKEAQNILSNIDDTNLLNEIIVTDDDVVLDKNELALEIIWNDTTNQPEPKIINSDLFGEQLDCPKGLSVKLNDKKSTETDNNLIENEEENKEEDKIEKQKRMLKEICARVLIPLFSLLSRTYAELNFKDMIFDEYTKDIINDILIHKKIILNKNSYDSIIRIMNNNDEIINNIREIYQNAPANKIHQLIAKHFIPSIEEIKNNAEIPTPINLVEEMLNKMPEEFWKRKNKVFEPCCGKGNFVMKIFEKFYNGLSEKYPNPSKRCKIIITKCLYYSDITPMNVFITTEILKCEIQSRTGNDKELKYSFNSNVGNTLELDINKKWCVDKFDAIIGNPPYQEVDKNGKTKGGTNLYTKFINYSFDVLNQNSYLLFITPISWLGPSKNIQMGNDILHNIFLKYDLLYLNLNECKKFFNVGSTFCYYLIQKKITKKLLTNVISEYKKLIEKNHIDFKKLINFDFLPIHITNDTLNLIEDITNKKNKLIIKRCRLLDTSNKSGKEHLKLKKDDKFKYITYHTSTKTYYSDIKLDLYDNIKILLNMAGYLKPELSKNCNLTESKFYIEVENEKIGNDLITYLNSDKITKYLELCKYSGFNSRPVIEKISYDTLNDVNDKVIKKSISNKIETVIETNLKKENDQKIKVKRNKSTVNK